MMKKTPTLRGYSRLLTEIKERIRSAQYEALKAVNKELVGLYWDIGRMIVERQKGDTWGKAVVERLAADLRNEFPGIRGFSRQNPWYMRQLFIEYNGKPRLQPLAGEISWSKHLVIMGRSKDDLEREFYIRMTRKFGWSKSTLIHQIEDQSYEKTLTSQTNFDKAVTAKTRRQAKLAVKDEYSFDFLKIGEEHAERELEQAIGRRIEDFLREMGGRFAFLGTQYRLEVSDKEYRDHQPDPGLGEGKPGDPATTRNDPRHRPHAARKSGEISNWRCLLALVGTAILGVQYK